jgi:hypothetical protein
MHDARQYLDAPSVADVKDCYAEYYRATSNEAMRTEICGVCSRKVRYREDDVRLVELKAIPHATRDRLKPLTSHPAHDLYEGCLLAPQGIVADPSMGKTQLYICAACFEDLQSKKVTPPKYSLVNGLWLGSVLEEISCLSFIEQLLLSHYYHRCYVFKLYPKHGGAGMDSSTLQRAMRGNVTSSDEQG